MQKDGVSSETAVWQGWPGIHARRRYEIRGHWERLAAGARPTPRNALSGSRKHMRAGSHGAYSTDCEGRLRRLVSIATRACSRTKPWPKRLRHVAASALFGAAGAHV
ncbi:hypothetical protein C0Z19_19295 [Trinickia soli]|uniref:Uncharacterized protein n=1 Tax=Trinickia soli TaxID=380675 RepID=A0A2N7VV77_9BURK|nr:hypothetical protein CIW54_06275 [Paraburkholderia sp. T12-10]PMS21033.1 hypothetical protein C0Z19_19295 [Trinickia soli]